MNAIEQAKANLVAKAGVITTEQAPTVEAVAATAQPNAPAAIEKEFNVYKSSLPNQRIALPNGRLLRITSGKYITDKADEIAFLDAEIEAGFPYLAKNGTITSSDLDPMAALRSRIIAEYVAEQAAGVKAAVPAPTLTPVETAKLVPASTSELGALSADSNSQTS